ncbi:hypothetical protein QFC21_003655 [Naganishia friedmannii]|uniref:Uncharacterized protein n=1 Tax=Naganishia friedmannii TaxID=89922 RepID=A0ACC2VNC1_9TREE|nr:hypothetical protein QFC21_003655 [Naganishia friedmannii]
MEDLAKSTDISDITLASSRFEPGKQGVGKLETRNRTDDPLDGYIDIYQRVFLQPGAFDNLTNLPQLYHQYRASAGNVSEHILPYEPYPTGLRRSDAPRDISTETEGDGIVLVVHVLQGPNGQVEKMSVCSGFAIGTAKSDEGQDTALESDTIVTCAHTLEEINRHLREPFAAMQPSCSFIIPSEGKPRLIASAQSSLPRSDLLVLSTVPTKRKPLTTLPVSPFPLAVGNGILTHIFGSPDVPSIMRSKNRRTAAGFAVTSGPAEVEEPINWLEGKAWRRWAQGEFLGYRSYTGQEVEAGTSSQLPHLLTSILPTHGSSGGPIIDSTTGAVVGMTSGRRMDNRVEGERGWGAAAEGIFEMFALPGFVPASKRIR